MAETKPLHILQVNKAYAPHIGGIESLVQDFSEQFLKMPQTQVQVLVCQDEANQRRKQKVVNGVPVT